jgi:antitoxin VapB
MQDTNTMATARVFRWGSGQAVLIPKEFEFRGKEVEIFREGEEIILREKRYGERLLDATMVVPENVFEGIKDNRPPRGGL